MKHLSLIGGIAAVSLTAIIGIRTYQDRPVERSHEELVHEAYVWQRLWDDDLTLAVEQSAGQLTGLCLLAAEVSYASGTPQIARVPIDFDAVSTLEKPMGLALRIGPYSGAYDRQTAWLETLAHELIDHARANGVEPAELQIDFDCAESKLTGYGQWLQAIRRRIEPVPLTFTALPCWLGRRDFKDLARSSDGFVLQVHSLTLPTGPSRDMTLCDCTDARQWVEQAARYGVDFRVALPTYGYVVGFDTEGEFLGLSAEGPSQTWPTGTHMEVVRSDPFALAELVQQLRQDRPKRCTGLIWYRLPVAKDRLNWTWTTLRAVMEGRVPDQRLRVEVEYPEPELADIVLVNTGEVDMSPDVRVEIGCEPDRILASDGLREFVMVRSHDARVLLEFNGTGTFNTMAPGDRWKIGWFRFREEMEIHPNVIMPAQKE